MALGRDSIGVPAPETGHHLQSNNDAHLHSFGLDGNHAQWRSDQLRLDVPEHPTKYMNDLEYPVVAAYAAGTGPTPVFKFHRFWAETDVAAVYAVYYLLFLDD